jgi:VIT1/CCC1 family predicted Fe2+/Mn2+ transporter
VLLFAVTTLSFAVFLLAALVLHRLHAISHLTGVHVPLHPQAELVHSHIPASITLSLQAVAILGMLVSMVLCVLVAIATPIQGMVSEMRERRAMHATQDRLEKRAA